MYTRDEAKAITDKVMNMVKGADVEVQLRGGENSGTRWANSSITTNLVQYDRNLSVTVRQGQKVGNATTKDFSDAGMKAMVDEAMAEAAKATDSPNLPEWIGAQDYIPVDSALPNAVNFGPAERARMVKDSLGVSDSKGVTASGYIPKSDQTNVTANSKGLFAYYRNADASFLLTCRMPDGSGSGWAGTSGIKDLSMIDAAALTTVAATKALKSRNAKAMEPGRYTVILEPRANARFLSLVTGVFNQGGGGGGGRGGAPGQDGPPPGGAAGGPPGGGGGGGGGGGFGGGGGNSFMRGKKPGDKIFSDKFSLKSDVGNSILRQSTILGDNRPAKPITWVENGILRNFAGGPGSVGVNNSLVQGGSEMSVEDMIKQTRRGLLVTFFWYIRGVPSESQPLLNTGMTRDGLFLIENGEITTPVQNFRWNMSPLVGYNNLDLVGKPVPMAMGESYDGGAALIPPVRINDFYMTSVSPAV